MSDVATGATCFCGCLQQPADPAANQLGWEMNAELCEQMKQFIVLDLTVPDRDRSNEDRFIDDGRGYWVSLREQVHGDQPSDPGNKRATRRWLKFGVKSRKKIGRFASRQGMPDVYELPDSTAREVSGWLLERELPQWAEELREKVDALNAEEEEEDMSEEGLGAYLKNVPPSPDKGPAGKPRNGLNRSLMSWDFRGPKTREPGRSVPMSAWFWVG